MMNEHDDDDCKDWGNPIYHLKRHLYNSETSKVYGPGWYFEWLGAEQLVGPFASEEEAKAGLHDYEERLDGPKET
jgi:hypothetical protein